MTIDRAELSAILSELLTEAYDGPSNPSMTWFADNEPGSGILGTLERLTAAQASTPLSASDPATPASHAGHLCFALGLANRALRGENAHETAVWKNSWNRERVGEAEWKELLAQLRAEYDALLQAISSGLQYDGRMNLSGVLGQLAHGAWHLGALRQGLGLVRTPARTPTAG